MINKKTAARREARRRDPDDLGGGVLHVEPGPAVSMRRRVAPESDAMRAGDRLPTATTNQSRRRTTGSAGGARTIDIQRHHDVGDREMVATVPRRAPGGKRPSEEHQTPGYPGGGPGSAGGRRLGTWLHGNSKMSSRRRPWHIHDACQGGGESPAVREQRSVPRQYARENNALALASRWLQSSRSRCRSDRAQTSPGQDLGTPPGLQGTRSPCDTVSPPCLDRRPPIGEVDGSRQSGLRWPDREAE